MIQFLRGDTAANNGYTGPEGSFTVDTEAMSIRLHDGVTEGGTVIGQIDEDGFIQQINVDGPIEISGPVTSPTLSLRSSSTTQSGSMSATDKAKLDGIDEGAQANVGDTFDESGTYSSLRAGATTKADVGLDSVDNTADTAKPVSNATQTALDAKAPLSNPTFTGVVTIDEGEI